MADRWWSSWVAAAVPYAVLLRQLVDGRVSAEEFEVVFLPLYKRDTTDWPSEIFDVLDGFFADVDDFCADPARGPVAHTRGPLLRISAALRKAARTVTSDARATSATGTSRLGWRH